VRAFEHRVVAKQVAVQVGPWQRQNLFLAFADLIQCRLQQRAAQASGPKSAAGPSASIQSRPAVGLALQHLVAGGQVQVAQQLTYLHAMLGVGFANVLARQARLQQRRLAFEFAQGLAVSVRKA
jgi:uncharacterized protein YejL (UPF0352 family)